MNLDILITKKMAMEMQEVYGEQECYMDIMAFFMMAMHKDPDSDSAFSAYRELLVIEDEGFLPENYHRHGAALETMSHKGMVFEHMSDHARFYFQHAWMWLLGWTEEMLASE
jgi:hypothetical protein